MTPPHPRHRRPPRNAPAARLCFQRPRHHRQFTLFYGDPELSTRPVYDIRPHSSPQAARSIRRHPRPRRAQSRLSLRRPNTRPFTERHPHLLWIALLIADLHPRPGRLPHLLAVAKQPVLPDERPARAAVTSPPPVLSASLWAERSSATNPSRNRRARHAKPYTPSRSDRPPHRGPGRQATSPYRIAAVHLLHPVRRLQNLPRLRSIRRPHQTRP